MALRSPWLFITAVASQQSRGNPSCWTHGFTFEQCCSALHGSSGNPNCWDAGAHNFDSCCQGEVFEAESCSDYVAHFDFAVLKLRPQAWEDCVEKMENEPETCNSEHITLDSCPSCAELSSHAVTYIRCVRTEQGRRVRATGGGDTDAGAARAAVGGWHYPTVFVPRTEGRDFSFIVPAFDAYVGSRLIVDGQWMHHEVRLLTSLLSAGDVVVDAGANIGGFTLPFAKTVGAFGANGLVHAFEPFRLLFQCLNANIMANGLANVMTYQAGLGNKAEMTQLRQPNLNAISNPSKMHVVAEVASELMVRTAGEEEPVKVMRLDDVAFGARGPVLIKVDVESMELPMMQGAERTLKRYRPLLYIEDSEIPPAGVTGHHTSKLMEFLFERGYVELDLIASGMYDATSTLFVPKERSEEVVARLRTINWADLR